MVRCATPDVGHLILWGTDGRPIAKHFIIPNDRSILRVVTLYDHLFQRVADWPNPFSWADIFFDALPNNDLKVVTSAGLLLTFSGGHLVSLVTFNKAFPWFRCKLRHFRGCFRHTAREQTNRIPPLRRLSQSVNLFLPQTYIPTMLLSPADATRALKEPSSI
jgi:hypothetical protein